MILRYLVKDIRAPETTTTTTATTATTRATTTESTTASTTMMMTTAKLLLLLVWFSFSLMRVTGVELDLDCNQARSGYVEGQEKLWYDCHPETCKFKCDGAKSGDITCDDKTGNWNSPSLPKGCSVKWSDLNYTMSCNQVTNGLPISAVSREVTAVDCVYFCRVQCKADDEAFDEVSSMGVFASGPA